MQKNLVLAILLSSAVYIFWYSMVEKKQQAPAPATAENALQQPSKTATSATDTPSQATAEAPLSENWAQNSVSIQLDKATYKFHTAGASIKSVVYQGPVTPVELIMDPMPGFLASFPDLNFRLAGKTSDSVIFEAKRGQLLIRKKFTLTGEAKINALEITAQNTAAKATELPGWDIKLGPGIGTVKSEEKENPKLWKAQYTLQEKGKKHPTIITVKKDQPATDWIWAGIDNRYFLAAVLGEDLNGGPLAFTQKELNDTEAPILSIPVAAVTLEPKETKTWRVPFYMGPKDYKLLKELGHGLDRSVDFGFFAPLAKLANSAVVFFYKLTGNYGVAIIILSIILQILIFPLSWKSYKAMAIMKKIQPEMQSIQQRYKNDPKRMNAEVLELYKRHGTNPLGGCLPMLLQIPVFFALFTALRNSWNLHGAPFIFWIKDLSAKDPYYVLPIVMGAIMFLQQHLNPQTTDKAQATMMKWMPIIFTFMFLTFPSGLVMYWLINSIFGFAQTMIMQKKMAVQ